MMSRARGALMLAGVVAALATACGAAQKSAGAPSVPREESAPANGATAPGTGTYTSAPAPATTEPLSPDEAGAAVDRAWSGLVKAEQALEAGASDCANACRALGSMDRAAGQLCDATRGDDPSRCDDAKARLLRARDQVRGACGGCPGGPSVDHDAPIPSAPSP
jgi:hypothetical protein